MTWTGWAMADRRRLSPSDGLAWVIGSGFGSGFSPVAPGTAGSAVAGAIFYGLTEAFGSPWLGFLELLVISLLIIAIGLPLGVWATGRMSTDADPDPGAAVWDEFVGMWITCLPITLLAFASGLLLPPYWIVLPFLLFRALDVFKPWPCRRLERLHGGWGIMLDDVAAGIWGALALGLLLAVLGVSGVLFGN